MRRFLLDFREAFRSVRKQGIVSASIVVCYTVGIATTVTMATVVDETLLRPFHYPHPEQLVAIRSSSKGGGERQSFSYDEVRALASSVGTVEQLAAYRDADFNLIAGGTTAARISGERVSANLWKLLGVAPLIGTTFAGHSDYVGDESSVVLSYATWKGVFGGDASVIGRRITLDGKQYRVDGVMPRNFAFPEVARLWIPLEITHDSAAGASRRFKVIGRLAGNIDARAAASALQVAASRVPPPALDNGAPQRILVLPFRDAIVNPSVRPMLLLLQALAIAVLLAAAANVTGLLLARGTSRSRELAVRIALGASRGQAIRLLLLESVLLALLGGAVALVVVTAALSGIRRAIPVALPTWMPLSLDVRMLVAAAGTALVVGALAGVAPALRLSGVSLSDELKTGSRNVFGHARTSRLRTTLSIAQLAVSVVLCVAAVLLARSYYNLLNTPPGFNADGVLTSRLILTGTGYSTAADRILATDRIEDALRRLRGVRTVALVSNVPFGNTNMNATVHIDGDASAQRGVTVAARAVSPGYFNTLGIRLLAGRAFTATDRDGMPPVAIVNRAMAKRFWPRSSPLGRQIRLGSGTDAKYLIVVGLARDSKDWSVAEPADPTLFTPYAQQPTEGIDVTVRATAPSEVIRASIDSTLTAVAPVIPHSTVSDLGDQVRLSSWQSRLYGVLLMAFAGFATILTVLGIYGISAESARERGRELAVRAALGATPSALSRLMLRGGVRLAVIGVVVGSTLAIGAARLLQSALYGVGATNVVTFVLCSLTLAAVTLIAFYVPVLSALRADCARLLRAD